MELPKFNAALAAVSDDELIDELERRARCCVVILLKGSENERENAANARFCYRGGYYTATGLVRTMAARMENSGGSD